ncbi:19538_t:CDS:1, partial [Racocetra fulgida]
PLISTLLSTFHYDIESNNLSEEYTSIFTKLLLFVQESINTPLNSSSSPPIPINYISLYDFSNQNL